MAYIEAGGKSSADLTGKIKTVRMSGNTVWGGGSKGSSCDITFTYDENGNVTGASGSTSWRADGPLSMSFVKNSIVVY